MKLSEKLSPIFADISDALVENGDGRARDRRISFFLRYVSGFLSILITGNYFTGLLLALGADDMFIGYMSMATSFCSCIQFISPLFLEKMARRKKFFVITQIPYHFINIVLLGIIPLLPIDGKTKLGLFMAANITVTLIGGFRSSGISIWLMQCLPDSKQSHYFAYLSLGNTLISTVTSFCASGLLDTFEEKEISLFGINPTITAILLLRAIALAAAIVEITLYSKLPEYPYKTDEISKARNGLKLLLLPLSNKKFMMTISIAFIFNYASAIICNFFNVYMLDVINVSYTFMSVCDVVVSPIAIIVMPIWSKYVHSKGWHRALPVSIFIFSFAYLLNAYVTVNSVNIVFPIIQAICKFSYPCISLVFSYLPYINMPETNRTAYNSFYALMGTIATFLGSSTGTFFMGATKGKIINFFGLDMMNYQYINLVQYALMLGIVLYIILNKKNLTNKQ